MGNIKRLNKRNVGLFLRVAESTPPSESCLLPSFSLLFRRSLSFHRRWRLFHGSLSTFVASVFVREENVCGWFQINESLKIEIFFSSSFSFVIFRENALLEIFKCFYREISRNFGGVR